MAKPRQPISAEYAVRECIDLAGAERLGRAIRKSDAFIYKCSDEREAHEISVRDALILDAEVCGSARAAPFRDLFIRNIAQAQQPCGGTIKDAMIAIQSELGDVAAKIRDAGQEDSAGGESLTVRERAAILAELEHVMRAAHDLFFIVNGKGEA